MRRPDLNTLVQFAVVARHLNMRRAAAELAIAPSTLSERIRALEVQVGARLLNRTTRSMSLTEHGRRLLDRVGEPVAHLADVSASIGVAGSDDILIGTLRINGPLPAVELRLMPLLTSFLAKHPGIRVEIVAQSEMVDIVGAGFDAGLRYDDKVAKDMVAIRLGDAQRMIIAGSPDYFRRRGIPENPAALERHDCIALVFKTGNILPWSLEKDGKAVDFLPGTRLMFNANALSLVAARAGVGLVYTFEDYVMDDIKSGKLVPVLEEWTPAFPGPLLYFPERRLMPPPLRAFVDYAKDKRTRRTSGM